MITGGVLDLVSGELDRVFSGNGLKFRGADALGLGDGQRDPEEGGHGAQAVLSESPPTASSALPVKEFRRTQNATEKGGAQGTL